MQKMLFAVMLMVASSITPAQAASKTAVVAQAGGDFTDPVAAMNALASWCGTPSAANPCLLKLMPGVYDIGANKVSMQSYVTLEGSGEYATRIRGNGPEAVIAGLFVEGAELRHLTIEAYGSSSAMSVLVNSPAGPSLLHVTLIAPGNGIVLSFGSWTNASMVLKDVKITSSGGYPVYCQGRGTLVVKSSEFFTSASAEALVLGLGDSNLPCEANVSGATLHSAGATAVNAAGAIVIRDSVLEGGASLGAAGTVVNSKVTGVVSAGGSVRIENTELSLPAVRVGTGKLLCRANFDPVLGAAVCR